MFSGKIYIKLLQSDMLDVLNRHEFLRFKSLIVFLSEQSLYYVSGLPTASAGATVMISGHENLPIEIRRSPAVVFLSKNSRHIFLNLHIINLLKLLHSYNNC